MKTIIALSLLSVALGCAAPTPTALKIVSSGMPAWMAETIGPATDILVAHGFEVYTENDTRADAHVISVGSVDDEYMPNPEALGVYTGDDILLRRSGLTNAHAVKCTLAHEIGHAVGMQHVDDDESLMSVHLSLPADQGCQWSADDQREAEVAQSYDAANRDSPMN